MIRSAPLLCLLLLGPRLLAAEPPRGIEGLCAEVERLIAPQLSAAPGLSVETLAEGSALAVADAVDARCRMRLGAPAPEGVQPWKLRMRVRLSRPRLLAVLELLDTSQSGAERAVLVDVVDVPLGPALEAWLGASGAGLQTWQAGVVDAPVLALCGADGNGDGVAEVVLVTRSEVLLFRWEEGGLEPLAKVPLEEKLVPLARVPGATALCRAEEGRLSVSVGIHDRNATLSFTFGPRGLGPTAVGEGVAVAWGPSAPVLAQGISGRGLFRWRGRELAQLASAPRRSASPRLVGVTQEGAPVIDDRLGAPLTMGSGITAADLDGDGAFELIRTRPLLPASSSSDRLIVSPLDDPSSVQHESAPVPGLLGAVGAVSVGPWWRVLAVRPMEGRSALLAFGRKTSGKVE